MQDCVLRMTEARQTPKRFTIRKKLRKLTERTHPGCELLVAQRREEHATFSCKCLNYFWMGKYPVQIGDLTTAN